MSGTHRQFNTSQDPDYVGPTGFEKKFYKTHFTMPEMPWKRDLLSGLNYHTLCIDGDEWIFGRLPKTGDSDNYVVQCVNKGIRHTSSNPRIIFRVARECTGQKRIRAA